MSDRPDLSNAAEGAILDAIYDMDVLDIDTLREKASDCAGSAAESACIYTYHCSEIINRYESDVDTSDVDDILSGQTYTAGQWSEAMVAYANAVAYLYVTREASALVDEIETAAETLADAANTYGADALPDDFDPDSPRITADCIHGWAVHEKEDEDGIHYWAPNELEGCRAVAVKVAGIWLSLTWTPAPAQNEVA